MKIFVLIFRKSHQKAPALINYHRCRYNWLTIAAAENTYSVSLSFSSTFAAKLMSTFDSPFGFLDVLGGSVTKVLFVSSFVLPSADLWDLLARTTLSCYFVTSSCTSISISLSQSISLIASGTRDNSETAFAAFIMGKFKLRSWIYSREVWSFYAPTDYWF